MGRRRGGGNQVMDGLRAFQATYGITKGLVDQSRAADAFKANSEVTENVSGDDAAKHFQENYVPQEGGPATANEYLMQNPEVLPGLSSEKKASFTMGGAKYDAAPTHQQKMAAGLQGAQNYYAADGQTDRANQMGLDASHSRAAELTVNEGERRNAQATDNDAARQKFVGVMKAFEDPATAANYIKDAYAKNIGNYGQGEHKDQQIQFSPTPDGGGIAWTVDANGKQTTDAKHFTKEQIIREAQNAYWQHTDPAGYAKAADDRAARMAAQQGKLENAIAIEQFKGDTKERVERARTEGRIAVKTTAPARSSGGGGGGGSRGGLSTAEMKNYDFFVSKGKTPEEAMALVTSRKRNTESWSETTKPNPLTGEPEKITRVSGAGLAPRAQAVPAPAPSKTAPAAAIEYLKNNPGAAPQFKQKYGYIPEGY